MKRRLAMLLAAVLLLGGCASLPEPEELHELETEREIRQPILQEKSEAPEAAETEYPAAFSLPWHQNQTMDPVLCGEGVQETAAALLYEPLFTLDGSFQPEGVLCESLEWDEAGLVCTLTLREGVTFSDGSPLTARDAAETLQRARESERYAYRLRNVTAVAANRVGQVMITLAAPNRGLAALLNIPVVKWSTAGELVPTGTGPYRLVSEGGSTFLLAREDWWQQKSLPAETVPLVPAKDQETALYLFSARRVELLPVDPTEDPSLTTGKAQSTGQPTSVMQFVGFNTAEGRLFADHRLRSLFSQGIDRETLVHAKLVDLALAAQFPISPLSPLYPRDLEKTYSEEAVRQELEKAGQNTGETRTLTLLVCAGNAFRSASARFIAENLSLLDWEIQVTELPWEAYLAALEAGEFDLYFGEVRLTADWDLTDLVGTEGALNYGGYTNETTDQLLLEFAGAEDQSGSARRLLSNLQASAPIAPVCFKNYAVLTHPGVVEGLSPAPGNIFRGMESWTIHLKEALPEEPEAESPEDESSEAA